MDTRFLESLIAVVESGSIAKAARLQCLTPAAVSQRIKALERDLDCELLLRTAHTAKPTAICLNLIPRARKLVREAEALKEDIDASGLSGTLRIGAISTALTGLLPSALHKLAKIAPLVKPHITPGTSQRLYDELQAEKLDAVITVEPPFKIPKTIVVNILRQEHLLLLSKTSDTRSIHEILSTEPYICYDSSSWGGLIAERYLKDNSLNPAMLCELDALEAIYVLVEKGMGVSLVPDWSGLILDRGKLSANLIKEDRYLRRLVLLSMKQAQHPKMIEEFRASFLF